jgi:hypothetical protein
MAPGASVQRFVIFAKPTDVRERVEELSQRATWHGLPLLRATDRGRWP